MDNNLKPPYKSDSHICNNPNCEWSPKKSVHGVEVSFNGRSFTFKLNDKAVVCDNIYMLEPQELAEKLGMDNEAASLVRFEALSIYQDRELSIDDLIDVLGITIKHDDVNKVVTFLTMLSAFTYDDQLNLSFRAESSTGKSYIPLEVSRLFPEDRVIKIAYSSPTAFFHEKGKIDEETKEIIIDLERKILIFLDQPHDQLLERLRPLLSHDQKELSYKITDKKEKHGLRTKNVKIIGFPAVIFCTGRLKIDEQEATRIILLSPEVSQEKFRKAVYLKFLKEADEEKFKEYVESNPKRKALRERVRKISELNVKKIVIPEAEKIAERFISTRKVLKPRHSRDVGRIMALIKVLALLNYNHRRMEKERDGVVIYASGKDVENALRLWDEISEPQEYNLSPFLLQVLRQVIEPITREKLLSNSEVLGATKLEICKKFLEVFGRPLNRVVLERDILPALEASGLISVEPHPQDKRKVIIIPTMVKELNDTVTPPSNVTFLQDHQDLRYVTREGGVYQSNESTPPSSIMARNNEDTPPSNVTYLSKDISFPGSDIQRNVTLDGGVSRVEHGDIKNLQENYEFQRNTSSNSGVYHSSEPTSPSSFLASSNEHRGDVVCSMCMHWDALKCLKYPDWIVVTPTARYARKCPFYNPRSGSGEVGHV
jgi:hypothetical protein